MKRKNNYFEAFYVLALFYFVQIILQLLINIPLNTNRLRTYIKVYMGLFMSRRNVFQQNFIFLVLGEFLGNIHVQNNFILILQS